MQFRIGLFLFLIWSFVLCAADVEQVITQADDLASKKDFDGAIEKYKTAMRLATDRDTIIDLKIKIGDCSFDDEEYGKSSKYYKIILSQYEDFYKKDYVVYKLCLTLSHLADWGYERDATKLNDLINWIKYYKTNCRNAEYLDELEELYTKGSAILEYKDFENIKFYFDNNMFKSAIFCCDWFLKKYPHSSRRSDTCLYKIKSVYVMNEDIIKNINNTRNKYGFENVLLDVFNNMRDILTFIDECKKDTNLMIEDLDVLSEKCYDMLCIVSSLRNKIV